MKKKQLAIIITFTFGFIISLAVGLSRSRYKIFKEVHRNTCELVYEKYVIKDEHLSKWYKECLAAVDKIKSSWTKQEYLEFLRHELYKLPFSHLDVYSPPEEKEMWEGIGKETGIEVHAIDGRFIVSFLEPAGPAVAAGVQVGDELIAINNKPIVSTYQISRAKGLLGLRRAGKEMQIQIAPTEFKKQQEPTIKTLANKVFLLRVPSFRPELFARDSWQALAGELEGAKKVIMDLRGNRGGNFVAMLRVASSFMCGVDEIGSIDQDRRQWIKVGEFNDDLDEQDHLLSLKEHDRILLKTFLDYPCINADLNILVNSDTASVSEMLARSLQSLKRAKVLGSMTAGEAVLAVWYKLDLLGPGYSLSIPEAIYRDIEGGSFEGMGLSPDKELYYDLEMALKGKDSWVNDSRTF